MLLNKVLIERLKKEFGVTKDIDIANKLNVTPYMFSSWKRSKGKLLEEVVRYGIEHSLDLNKIILGKTPVTTTNASISVIAAEDLFEYFLDPKVKISELSKTGIPFADEIEMGFQVISKNMEPTIEVSSYVFGQEITLDKIYKGKIYVVHVDKKGVFICRFLKKTKDIYVFTSDNEDFIDFKFHENQIVSIFCVYNMLSNL